jgi:hypothetical protein
MSKKEVFEIIDFLSYDDEINEKEVFLENMEEICKKIKKNEDVIKYFMNNDGNIGDIFDGISVVSCNDDCKLPDCLGDYEWGDSHIKISTALKLKNNVIKNNMLYNIAHYCVLNDFKATNLSKNPYKIDVFHINNKLFNKRVMIKSGCEISLFIEYDIKYTIPSYCKSELLTSEEYSNLFNDVSKEFNLSNFFNIGFSDYNIKIEVTLTNCLDTNIQLIDDFIKNAYSGYTNKIKELKKSNEKYFKKQLTQQKVNKF